MESVKSLGKYYVKYTLVAALVLSISLFYGFVAVLMNFIRRLREGPSFFEVKERTLPPACLQDSAWGRHAYIKLKVRKHEDSYEDTVPTANDIAHYFLRRK